MQISRLSLSSSTCEFISFVVCFIISITKLTIPDFRATESSFVLTALVRPSCLIIDEIGHCDFDKENTRLFFDMIDRRYNKEGAYNMVFTSNKTLNQWKNNFDEDDALLCSLDRVFDNVIVVNIRG